MNRRAFEQIVGELNAELEEDEVGLWVIVRAVRRHQLHESLAGGLRSAVALICDELIENGASLGMYDAAGQFEYWPDQSSTQRMLTAWGELNADPDIGEVAWVRNPTIFDR